MSAPTGRCRLGRCACCLVLQTGFPYTQTEHADGTSIHHRTFQGRARQQASTIAKREHIAAIISARLATPHAANNLLKTLHTLFEHAIAINMITSNPATDVRKFRIQTDGFRAWTESDVAQFVAHHPVGTRARLALALLLTGQRRSDIVRMGWQHISDGAIAVKQVKTGVPLLIPLDIDPLLPEALQSAPKTNMTFLVAKSGAPISPRGFTSWFRLKCNDAGLPECSAHGLRKLVATRLANIGCSEDEIKAITGHKSSSEVARYTKARDQPPSRPKGRLGSSSGHSAAASRRTRIVQPPTP